MFFLGLLTKKRLLNESLLISPKLPSTSTELNSVNNEILNLEKANFKLNSFNLLENIQSSKNQVASTSSLSIQPKSTFYIIIKNNKIIFINIFY